MLANVAIDFVAIRVLTVYFHTSFVGVNRHRHCASVWSLAVFIYNNDDNILFTHRYSFIVWWACAISVEQDSFPPPTADVTHYSCVCIIRVTLDNKCEFPWLGLLFWFPLPVLTLVGLANISFSFPPYTPPMPLFQITFESLTGFGNKRSLALLLSLQAAGVMFLPLQHPTPDNWNPQSSIIDYNRLGYSLLGYD